LRISTVRAGISPPPRDRLRPRRKTPDRTRRRIFAGILAARARRRIAKENSEKLGK